MYACVFVFFFVETKEINMELITISEWLYSQTILIAQTAKKRCVQFLSYNVPF